MVHPVIITPFIEKLMFFPLISHIYCMPNSKFSIYLIPFYSWTLYCYISLSAYLCASITQFKILRTNDICEYHSLLSLFKVFLLFSSSLENLRILLSSSRGRRSLLAVTIDTMLNLWIHLENADISQHDMSICSNFFGFRPAGLRLCWLALSFSLWFLL